MGHDHFVSDSSLICYPTIRCRVIRLIKVTIKFTLEQAMKSQRGEQTYSSSLSSTSALDEGGWSTPRLGRLTPGNNPYPSYSRLEGPVWTPSGIETATSLLVALCVPPYLKLLFRNSSPKGCQPTSNWIHLDLLSMLCRPLNSIKREKD